MATVRLGDAVTNRSSQFASALATGLVVETLGASPNQVYIGRAGARIDRTSRAGVFAGGSQAGRTRSTSGAVTSGPIVVQHLGCQGTNGRWRSNTAASDELDQADVNGGRARVKGEHLRRAAVAQGEGRADVATLLGGRLRLENIVAKTYVRAANNGTFQMNADGTSLGRILFDGREVEQPDAGQTIRVGNAAKITFRQVHRFARGIESTGVIIELLGGQGAIIELAKSRTFVR